MSMPSTSVETVESFDDFIPLPGADQVVTPDSTPKPSVFSRSSSADFSFLEEKETPDETPAGEEPEASTEPLSTEDLIKEITEEGEESNQEGNPAASAKKPARSSGIHSVLNTLVEKGTIFPFEGEKKLEDYSNTELVELLEANFAERERVIREQTPVEFFEALPDEMKAAAQYVMSGGTDIRGMFRALSHVQEVRELNPSNESDQVQIVRQYLQSSDWGTDDEIEEEISSYRDLGTLAKKAGQMKPKLDKMHEEVIDNQIRHQEEQKRQIQEARQTYVQSIYDTLAKGELNGIKLDRRQQNFIYNELTQNKYQSSSGRPTNLLGHLLERYQFQEPRFDLISEATWLLADPEGYKAQIRQQAKNETTIETVKKLKTEETRKLATGAPVVQDEPEKRPTLPRQRNIFSRS